jgi:ribosomal-protein-alanine N-acetyltransferase
MLFSVLPLPSTSAENLADIHRTCFPDPWSVEDFQLLLNDSVCFGFWAMIDSQKPIGFILARAVQGEAEILTFAVHPDHRQQGIGETLLKNLQDFCYFSQVEKLYLEVAVNNDSAIHLYKKTGFQKIGNRPNYYIHQTGEKIDATVMMWASY